MLDERTRRTVAAYQAFVSTDSTRMLAEHATQDPAPGILAFFHRTRADVPAYASFLQERKVDADAVRTLDDFRRLPLMTKADYHLRYPLGERCRSGDLDSCDMIAVSSGSTGEPTFWPRFLADEFAVATRFEQVFRDNFEADRRRTLAVVCFPLGTWVGGMFTASCCRHLASKGYPITVVAPGNQKAEIFRVVQALAPMFEQTVLLGYPPFVKDVVDAGIAEGIDWSAYRIKLVLAGEVFSEDWRSLMVERAKMTDPRRDVASLYGTADAGVLGNETVLSVGIRRFLAERPDAARALFGEARLPTLVQYDPFSRFFETHERTLVFTGDGGVPLVRYHISDTGGVVPHAAMIEQLLGFGFDAEAEARASGVRSVHALPFVYVFGRSHFAVSYYGANVFPDTVSIGLEQPGTRAHVTGKFVLEVEEDEHHDKRLAIAVELAQGVAPDDEVTKAVEVAVLDVLLRLNSEFANYVPEERKRPKVTLWPAGHPTYFPVGVKHRYARK